MILESLQITDFRVFRGQHHFDLAPRTKYKKKRPIVLFGGLNGAGKTTTLTAVRLALYGRQSLGPGTSQKAYENYLANSIHRSRDLFIQANAASIELTFSYASMGLVKCYTVKRQWMTQGKRVIESLSIEEDGHILNELNAEQCQGFLNELVPIGVSDLFFFDGEKIKELAKDTQGNSLGDSIKNLLGLDIIETLDADLAVLARNEAKKGATARDQKRIARLEKALEKAELKANKELENWERAKTRTAEHNVNLSKLETELSSRGGAWAATREQELKREADLRAEKQSLENQLRELIGGSYPLALAKTFTQRLHQQLAQEQREKQRQATCELIGTHLVTLKGKLADSLDAGNLERVTALIDDEFRVTQETPSIPILHDRSDSALAHIQAAIESASQQERVKANSLRDELKAIEQSLDKIGKNIARAPEQSAIKPMMDKITREQAKRADSLAKERGYLEAHKKALREAMKLVRDLDKLSERQSTDEQKSRTLFFADGARSLLKDFSKEMTLRKIKDLELEFVESFRQLARKDDISLQASINPKTFAVKLLTPEGYEVDKDDLSAGEQQIYAIAILEALGKTSGRKLPIIIDTPLGRLDSKHRANLINNYFPRASQQVIILSTDTEVDEDFYRDLSTDISHAFKLDYDGATGSTAAQEGYFWKAKQEEIA